VPPDSGRAGTEQFEFRKTAGRNPYQVKREGLESPSFLFAENLGQGRLVL
jgi:hypothetical protein